MRSRVLFFFLITLSWSALAQQIPVAEPCATMEEDRKSRARFPERGSLNDLENVIQKKIREIELAKAQGRTESTVLSIPIIVHVVHNGEAVGTGTNISQAQVQAQIEVLNEDFRRKPGTPGFNSNPVGADIELEFCLSPVDQNGNVMTEPGIHRYNGARADWSRDQIENSLKPTTIWNPNLFYNIWTVRFASSDANLIGYAQFPDQSGLAGLPTSGPASTDGVVVRFQSFGSTDKGTFPVMVAPYNKGRTLTHETGHWLGLRHIWGDGGCSADDFVTDTPNADGPSSGCPIGRISCSVVNMVENYMDYTNDACMNIFTQGQKTRMMAVLQVSPRRKSLVESNLCSPIVADVPTANFDVNSTVVLLGGDATFTDLSTNFPTNWAWTFEGGDPATSTSRNPVVRYHTPGVYTVTLVATNALGSSAPLERTDYILVSEEGLCSSDNNFKSTDTQSLIKLSAFGSYSGYLTGHNSSKFGAVSEYFSNPLRYQYISGVNIRFGKAKIVNEDATADVVVWDARGAQNAPGSVIERKTVLLQQIQEDVNANEATTIYFDRETPVFGRPYQVGLELIYAGDTLAIFSSANGESTGVTSWLKTQAGVWTPYTIELGANVAMDIEPFVGMKPSVQVSSSALLVNPGQQVILNGRGASIFVWNADDGSVVNYTGPQLIVNPVQTTTYVTTGSGLELCNNTASTTIFVRDGVVGVEEEEPESQLSLYPNPGRELTVQIRNVKMGSVVITLQNLTGQVYQKRTVIKSGNQLDYAIDVSGMAAGMYILSVDQGGKIMHRKWIKQ
ncbi:MAG: T9SS type A sorting domain-containing protein [Cyclobacteriaceae bacterium]|nr:T9SS type A sorting domain-containing protein [Cyclobacteriaceae bacterium]